MKLADWEEYREIEALLKPDPEIKPEEIPGILASFVDDCEQAEWERSALSCRQPDE